MQRRREDIEGKRPRITVSLDPDDYDWVQQFEGSSDSYKISKIIKQARAAGVAPDTQSSSHSIAELADWLATKKSKPAKELHKLLSEFLEASQ